MNYQKIPHTIVRNGIYYLNFRLNGKKFIRQSLLTDSARQAKILVSKMLPSIIKIKNQMELTNEESDILKIKSFNQSMRLVVNRAREIANGAMYPTSNAGIRYLDEWNDQIADIEQEDAHLYEEHEFSNYLESECYNQPTKHALALLSSPDKTPEQRAKDIINVVMKPTDYGYHNALFVFSYIFKIQEKIAADIEALDYVNANAKLESLDAYVDKLIGCETEYPSNVAQPQSLSLIEEAKTVTSLSLKEAFNQFIESKTTGKGRWAEKQLDANKRNADTLIALIGDMPIKDINSHVLDVAFNIALQMPKRNKNPYSRLSLSECIELAQTGDLDEDDIVTVKTVKELKKLLQGLYTFLKIKREIDKSPTEGMLINLSSNTRRGAFSHAQMQSIVQYALTQSEGYKKWPLLIMAYTGMRNGEVMQLRKQDIKHDTASNFHYFHITPDAGAVKTKAAIRTIPIHSKLIEQGFLAFVMHSNERLFEQGARALTSYYQRFKKVLQLPDIDENSDVLSLYSIRHRVITTLQSKGVNSSTTQQLVGHAKQSTITDRYTHDIDISSLKLAVEVIQY
ncbi:tyrosine-type recombinase/integrase [Shewanella sp. AC34-MNA-CIBAN-0136]|uniref:tyrosine-type recombinase/integrase n=1 Tax=Shewanella sp. AC34-MNA-CIBAN-0136 TaxID=3140463 RepID=UPI00331CF85A